MKEFLSVKLNIMIFHTYISKIFSLDFQMAAPAFQYKSFGNLKWTPESSNQKNTKRGVKL